MAEMKPVAEMKDSGIEWVGQIPNNWKVVPIRSCFDEVIEKNKDGLVKNALKFTYGEIVPKTNFDAEEDDYVADTILNYYVVYPGTIMINGLNLNFDFITQRTGLVKEKGIITSAYVGIVPKDSLVTLPEFMNYLFKAYDYRMAFHNMGGGVRKILNFTRLKSQMVCFPDLADQQAIADYLDDRCSKIDEIIAEATGSVEEYKELKQAVIFEAVTKGLDKNVPMKDSGISSIGLIPINWNIKRVKNIMFERTDRTADGHEEPLSVTQQFGIVKSADIQVANPSTTYENYRLVSVGDIVFNKYKAHSGVFFESPYDGMVTFNYSVYRCYDTELPKYYELLFHTRACIDEFRQRMHGVGESISPLYTRDLMRIPIIEPPLNEQVAIVDYLNTKVVKFDSLISEKQSLISDLQAYKKSLIYEVVTGKRRVV